MLNVEEKRGTGTKDFPDSVPMTGYHGEILLGEELLRFAEPVKTFQKRELFRQLHDYVYGPDNDRVFILFGLWRTGKTTLIRRMILEMSEDMRERAAFIQIRPGESLASLNQDLKLLEKQGFRYVFIAQKPRFLG